MDDDTMQQTARSNHPPAPGPTAAANGAGAQAVIDRQLAHSFPASDPPSWWAGPGPAAMNDPTTSRRDPWPSGAGAGRTAAVPAAARDGGASATPPERFFVGRRLGPTEVLVVSLRGVAPLVHHHRLGAYPFDWGRHGEGVYELAYGLLAELTGACPPASICGAMEVEILAFLPYQGFTVLERDVDRWLGQLVSTEQRAAWPEPPPAAPPPGPRQRRRRPHRR